MFAVGRCQRDDLGCIDHRAAAKTDHRVAALAVEGRDALLDPLDRRIGRDGVEHRESRARLGQRIGHRRQQAQRGDRSVGHDEQLAVAEISEGTAQLGRRSGPDQQQGLRDRQLARDHTGCALERWQAD